MSVKSFKFVSPGVFINEIDNSFRPRRPDAIGPVVIGRAARGPAMQPIKVESYSDFVEIFGDTVPGNGGGDVYRDGECNASLATDTVMGMDEMDDSILESFAIGWPQDLSWLSGPLQATGDESYKRMG